LKGDAGAEQRGANQAEEQLGGVGGAVLQKGFEGVFQRLGKRHEKNEKPKWKHERAQSLPAEAQAAGTKKEQKQGKGRPCEGIDHSEAQSGTERKKVSGEEEQAGGEWEDGEFAVGLGIGGQEVLL
jgi:hypothetical protein